MNSLPRKGFTSSWVRLLDHGTRPLLSAPLPLQLYSPNSTLLHKQRKKEISLFVGFSDRAGFSLVAESLQLPLPVSVVPVTPAHRSDDISNVTVWINSCRVVSPSSSQVNLPGSSDVTVHKGETSIITLFTSMVSCDRTKSPCGWADITVLWCFPQIKFYIFFFYLYTQKMNWYDVLLYLVKRLGVAEDEIDTSLDVTLEKVVRTSCIIKSVLWS